VIIANTMRALGEALILAAEGRHCFPCSSSKRPATPRGFLDASADPVVLQELWARDPGRLVGVRTGRSSGIDILDLDRKHGEAIVWLASSHDRLPVTRVHRARSGGLHLVFQHGRDVRRSASRIAPGIDVRGDGGYIIWWPALPVVCNAPFAPWPEWLSAPLPSQRSVVPRVTVPDGHAVTRCIVPQTEFAALPAPQNFFTGDEAIGTFSTQSEALRAIPTRRA
jgi:hypothetical protein